jgi:hypothetical protein
MNPTPKVMRAPLPPGFMRGGWSAKSIPNSVDSFAWPATKFKCPGYTARGVAHNCGVVFESYTGAAQRCQTCRSAHKREWFRLRSQQRRQNAKQ